MEDFRSWYWLETVVDLGGLKPASERLYRTPSTISHAIKQLEKRIGVQLVQTRARRIELTDAGRILLEHMRPLIRELEGVNSIISQFREGGPAMVHLAVDQSVDQRWVIEALSAFAQQWPHARIAMHETVLAGGPNLFLNREVEVYVGPETIADHTALNLGEVTFVPVAAPNHPLVAEGEQGLLTDPQLRQYRQIVIRDSQPGQGTNSGWQGSAQRITVDHQHTALAMIREGLGFSWLPEHAVENEPGVVALNVSSLMYDYAPVRLYRHAMVIANPAHAQLVSLLCSYGAESQAVDEPV